MIVSHRHRFIFVRTRKTAGTSVEIALSKFCGPDDVITRDADDALRRELGYPGPQNDGGIPLSAYTFSEWRRLLTRGERARFKNHTPAARIRSLVGAEIWHGYYKFAIERDPWDKAISLYYWRTRDRIIAYENLASQLEEIRQQLRLPEPVTLPRAKSSHRTEKSHYSELIGEAERAVIDKACKREIELLGYQFHHVARKSEVS
jgi:hypothetical protein